MNIISGIGESGFLAHSAFSAGIATKDSNGNDITATYLTGVDLTPYQTTAGMTAYLTTGDSAEFMTTAERSDYIPTGVSSEFYTTANTANYISEVPDTYLQNTDLGITDNKITAISGVELSAGGDVPEGVMVESGIEYNSQGYINGYSGSAIATIDQERQWFTHDDTLCHVSNSAQYALGVNMSAISADLARMMGVDETVLYSDLTGRPVAVGQYIDLSESPLNFEYVEIYLNGSSPSGSNNIGNGYEKVPYLQLKTSNGLEFHKEFVGSVAGATSTVHDMGCGYSGTSGTRWTKWYGYSYNVANKTTDFNNNQHLNIWQVVGIGRKS